MKKFDRLILAVIIVYVLAALAAGCFAWKLCEQTDGTYRVEENRLIFEVEEMFKESLSGQSGADTDLRDMAGSISAEKYSSILSIDFLPAGEENRDAIMVFYRKKSGYQMQETMTDIVPIYIDDELKGFLRMDIERSVNRMNILAVVELSLFIMAALLLAVLWYTRTHIIAPFWRMQDLTYGLSKGNLKGEIKQEKNHFFGELERNLSLLKDELEVKKKRELELLRERKLLTLSLSHDLKTPLSTIQLYNRALWQGEYETQEKQREIYRQIDLKCNEIENYMGELLTSSREDIVDITVEREEFYLRELMERVLSVYREKCDLRKIELTVGTYENRLLVGDLHRLVEVFENLFENAFKYGDGLRIDITFDEEDYCQLIRVFNSGEPVSENEFAHLFESFFRGTNTHGRQGHGLGLYISREIMHKMGGELFAQSGEDGMTFVVVLPL